MADMFTQASFAFACTPAERALLKEAFRASGDLNFGVEPDPPSGELLALFPPITPDEPWSGFCEAFPDPDYPSLGAVIRDDGPRVARDDDALVSAWVHGTTDFQPAAVAEIVRRCCPATLARGAIGFEWAMTCSKPRVGEFGGGWCAIFADGIEIEDDRRAAGRGARGRGRVRPRWRPTAASAGATSVFA